MSSKKEDKIIIKQFRDSSSNFWVDNIHYHLNEQNEIVFCAGGIDSEDKREVLRQYIRRNKKTFKPREIVQEITYKEVFRFGKYINKTLMEFEDKAYLKWCIKNYNFKENEIVLKEEIIKYLK